MKLQITALKARERQQELLNTSQKPSPKDQSNVSQKKVAAGMKKITEILKRIMEENDAMQKATQINLDLISEEMNAIDYHTQKRILSDSTANMAQLMHHPRRWGGSILSSTKNSFKLDDSESSASTSPYNHHSDKTDGNNNNNNDNNGSSNHNITSSSDNFLFYRRNFSPSSSTPSSVCKEKERDWRSSHLALSDKTDRDSGKRAAAVDEIKEMEHVPEEYVDDDEELLGVILEEEEDEVKIALSRINSDEIPRPTTSTKA